MPTYRDLSAGERGTDETLAVIQQFVKTSLLDPSIKDLAVRIVRSSGVNTRDLVRSSKAIYDWIRKNVSYVRDPVGVEVVQSPKVTLEKKYGDCDDHSTLLASLVSSLGIPVRFKVVGPDKNHFSHIFPEVQIRGRWFAADTTSLSRRFGQGFPEIGASKMYSALSCPLGADELPITVGEFQKIIYDAAYNQLVQNWNGGLIDRSDVGGYLTVIDNNNAPFGNSAVIKPAVRDAIADFLAYVNRNGLHSTKPYATLSGLEGLDGFLSSVWNAVKSVGKTVIGAVTGGGTQTVVVKTEPKASETAPAVRYEAPGSTTTYTPGTGVVTTPRDNTLLYVGIGAAALVLLILVMKK